MFKWTITDTNLTCQITPDFGLCAAQVLKAQHPKVSSVSLGARHLNGEMLEIASDGVVRPGEVGEMLRGKHRSSTFTEISMINGISRGKNGE